MGMWAGFTVRDRVRVRVRACDRRCRACGAAEADDAIGERQASRAERQVSFFLKPLALGKRLAQANTLIYGAAEVLLRVRARGRARGRPRVGVRGRGRGGVRARARVGAWCRRGPA